MSAFAFPTGKRLILYHTNWATYARNYQIRDLPINFITDINYAFMDIRPDGPGGALVPALTDAWADTDKRYTDPQSCVPPPDSWDEDPSNVGPWGNFGQLLKLKKMGKPFGLGFSIGGWTLSKKFSDAVKGESERQAFVNGICHVFEKWPGLFNRVDIDWEYICPPDKVWGEPDNGRRTEDPHNFVAFLALLRSRLPPGCEITMCAPSDPVKARYMPLAQISNYVTSINVMTYDHASSAWGACTAGHQTNLYPTPYAPLSVAGSVDAYLAAGVPAHKIVIGVAAYSRGFANTDGLGCPSHGQVPDQSWEAGVCDYKTLPRPGATEYWDDRAKASYSYDPTKRVLNSYDTPQSVYEKCKFVWDRGLQGIIVWESSGDFPAVHERSLVKALWEGLANDPRKY
ncbi:glycoside hydrolase [Gaertneriomyces semiglobifer]|nr:glycoside hydrolase [Gaertneriomyces semiglobifer]